MKSILKTFGLAALAGIATPVTLQAAEIPCQVQSGGPAILSFDGANKNDGYGLLTVTVPEHPYNSMGNDFKGQDPRTAVTSHGFIDLAAPDAKPGPAAFPFYIGNAKSLIVSVTAPDNKVLNVITCNIPAP